MTLHLRATGRHLPYGITQCYLPPDTSERAPPNPSYRKTSYKRPRRLLEHAPQNPGVPGVYWRYGVYPPCRRLTGLGVSVLSITLDQMSHLI